MYADIIIEYPIKSLDKCFTYYINEKYLSIIKVGMKVKVPFNNTILNGIIISIHNNKPAYEVKDIYSIVNKDIYLNEELMELGKYLKEETLCTLISAYETMLPSALKVKKNKDYSKYLTYITLNTNYNKIEEYKNTFPKRIKQIEILEKLMNGRILKSDLSTEAVNMLLQYNLVKEEKEKVYSIKNNLNKSSLVSLNEEQNFAYRQVRNNLDRFNTYLLHGVTGSGKTEVYMKLISDVINNGKTAIVLVPEICLTTQTVNRFYNKFGSSVAIFHSGLSDGEKYDEYMKIYNDEVKIVVGTRSSIFVPIKNLGLIIIDEEHSENYKQDSNPRYDTHKMALFRAKYNNIPLILASATPSLESMARANKGIYKLLMLKNRVNGLDLPKTEIVDMTESAKNGNLIISEKLDKKIKERLIKKEQVILLLNRRGHSTFISCKNCGYTYKCPNCDVTLTYHKTSDNLRCHLCGYVIKKDSNCPNCHEESLNYLGIGTEKVEEYLNMLYPNSKVLRMDQDTTTKKGSYQKMLDDFADHKYDILLGTQMISKGLDFKDVTLVGIINADTSLNIPDFRSNEKTFSLLYQTSGRSGRNKSGEVIIQSYNPDNRVLNFVKDNNYHDFYLYEMDIRHKLKYPPYTYITLIEIKSKSYEKLSKEANKLKNVLGKYLDNKTIIYGPTPASKFRINNIYTFNIIIKYTFDNNLKNILKKLDNYYIDDKDININITFNPLHF